MVIVTAKSSAIEVITQDEAAKLYLGRTTTLADNTSVTLIDLPPGAERDRFYQALTGKNPVQIRANWSRQVFTGRALPPRQADSLEQLRDWLLSDERSIGYMPASGLGDGLRPLLVIGR
ncbi:MAG: hypothetical protein KDH20_07580 [Rhodocyclaceae bacterium]|nr:hypothetical protein [Rhodocyclaceae bacterium]